MAIENNKYNSLAAELNDESTADPETLTVENLFETGAPRNRAGSNPSLDIQQLRTRWSGLEKEIEAREALTTRLNRRLLDSQKRLARAVTQQSDREAENLSLRANLKDSQGYRQALESQLQTTDKESKRTIAKLSRKLQRLEKANEDVERQLENKDNAIAALLSELASRSRTIDSVGEIQNVIHEIDGRMSDRIGKKSAVAKDRLARLLIGNVEGQKLRFPLFKDRLTIGRTAQNDIQLKAHFVSRRHAVIVTEGGQSRIVDWGSKNGVYVNDTRVAEQTLRNGDIVAIGTAEFRYEERVKR